MSNDDTVLEVQGITKRFPGILANDNVDLALHRGEILALLGENGAGKTTLMNIVYGLYHADAGAIRVKGDVIRFSSPRDAIHHGIGMVHQHFQLIPVMSVAENVTLGEESTVAVNPVQRLLGSRLEGIERAIQRGWGALWRVLIPFLAVAIGLLVAEVTLQLVYIFATRFLPDAITSTFSFQRLSVVSQATMALRQLYIDHPAETRLALYLPELVGGVAGALIMVTGYLYARRTWPNLNALLDSVINSVLDLLATGLTFQDNRRAATRVRDLSRKYGLEVDPDAIIEKLPIGMQQRVEIIKALYRRADILILDEPTSVLTPQEIQELFKIMRNLAAEGVSIIFISHKLKEVLTIADRIVVMRAGKVVGTALPAQSTESSLANMMVGREVILKVSKGEAHPGGVVLNVEHLSAIDDRGAAVLDDVNFEVRAGEVLGIAGVQGNGQTELVEVLTGLRKPSRGDFRVEGHTFTSTHDLDPRRVTEANTAHVPEDRQRYGMVMPFPVADNLVLNHYYSTPYASAPSYRQLPVVLVVYGVIFGIIFVVGLAVWDSVLLPALKSALNLAALDPRTSALPFLLALVLTIVYIVIAVIVGHLVANLGVQAVRRAWRERGADHGGLVVNEKAVDSNAVDLVKEFDIRTPSIEISAGSLSGGNQQKMVVARELSRQPRLLIAAQPTRGIDVGAIEFIHQRIIQQRDEGAAVLLVSAELDEIIALSDRIAVMYRGQIIATLPGASATREQLGLLMAGIKNAAPVGAVQE